MPVGCQHRRECRLLGGRQRCLAHDRRRKPGHRLYQCFDLGVQQHLAVAGLDLLDVCYSECCQFVAVPLLEVRPCVLSVLVKNSTDDRATYSQDQNERSCNYEPTHTGLHPEVDGQTATIKLEGLRKCRPRGVGSAKFLLWVVN